jgi:hypothetical protein
MALLDRIQSRPHLILNKDDTELGHDRVVRGISFRVSIEEPLTGTDGPYQSRRWPVAFASRRACDSRRHDTSRVGNALTRAETEYTPQLVQVVSWKSHESGPFPAEFIDTHTRSVLQRLSLVGSIHVRNRHR